MVLILLPFHLSLVGWNTLGGRRFWLTDRYGNMFYFAHLSGFSPLAKDGAQVKRGDVIGFVGNIVGASFGIDGRASCRRRRGGRALCGRRRRRGFYD